MQKEKDKLLLQHQINQFNELTALQYHLFVTIDDKNRETMLKQMEEIKNIYEEVREKDFDIFKKKILDENYEQIK